MAPWRVLPSTQQPVPGGARGAGGAREGAAAPAVFPPDLHDGRHLRLKGALLLVWALVSFGVCFFARDLQWMVAGWPLGYWMASQGAVLVFMVLVLVYAQAMSRFEREDALAAATAASPATAAVDGAAVPHEGDPAGPGQRAVLPSGSVPATVADGDAPDRERHGA